MAGGTAHTPAVSPSLPVLPALLLLLLLTAGCLLLGSGTSWAQEGDEAGGSGEKVSVLGEELEVEVEAPEEPDSPGVLTVKDPKSPGVLNNIAHVAPPGTATQSLANIAQHFGWEEDVARNTLLLLAVEEEQFDTRVEPFLISLFFKKGFSILPSVGEGHQFSRDSIVRGKVANAKLFVTTRELVRIIFLSPMRNIQIIYPQDGTQPQIFAPDPAGQIAVRQSLLKQYLR